MKFSIFRETLLVILSDSQEAEEFLSKNSDSQFARRTYIRSVFSSIEGCIWVIKQVCLSIKDPKGKSIFSPAELALLREETYELKNNGDVKTSPKFLKLPDNIKFLFGYISKKSGKPLDIQVGSKSWQSFLIALAIRHRVTHPKDSLAFNISDDEITSCEEAVSWFNTITMQAITVMYNLPISEVNSKIEEVKAEKKANSSQSSRS